LLLAKKVKEDEVANLEAQIKAEVENAVAHALTLPPPDPEEARRGVFIEQ